MCGIVGYISKDEKQYQTAKEHFMRFAVALDTLRGPDSTGLIHVRRDFEVSVNHSILPGDEFVHTQAFINNVGNAWAQVGHNRAATKGSVKLCNAHPFTFGDVTMVHNGTLSNMGANMPTFRKDFDVDSMQISYALSQASPEDAAKVLATIAGSFALVWTDKRDNSVNMCRNSARPLHFGFNSRKDHMWFMSDGHHLHSINKSLTGHDAHAVSLYELDRMKILKWKKGSLIPEVTKFDAYVAPAPVKQSPKKKNKAIETALTKAANKWKNRSVFKPEQDVRTDIAGRSRTVPKIMQEVLFKEMSLTPDDLLQFQPDDRVLLKNGRCNVLGTMVHSEWGDSTWECVLYNVDLALYENYWRQDWCIRPVGLCPSQDYDPKHCAILGQLVHTMWEHDDDEAADEGKALTVGPGGKEVEWEVLKKQLDSGCINCGGNLDCDSVADHVYVNNGQDIMCSDCVVEWLETYNNEYGQPENQQEYAERKLILMN
jgi:predicted glutamine amidotransferase